jgi:hypothetical protein
MTHDRGDTLVVIILVIIVQSNGGFLFEQYCLEGLECCIFCTVTLMLSGLNHLKRIYATIKP